MQAKWYLLRKVDLPLATPSILAGVNQTVMLSLAMVVVASLIGAKGLGQDVLEALTICKCWSRYSCGCCNFICCINLR